MGRRVRDERREKREDYAAKISKNKRKNSLMAAGILALIALVVGYAGFVFVTMVLLFEMDLVLLFTTVVTMLLFSLEAARFFLPGFNRLIYSQLNGLFKLEEFPIPQAYTAKSDCGNSLHH